MQAVLVFDIAAFRVEFPAFNNAAAYPNATLQAYWNNATNYISSTNYGWLNCAPRQQALNLLTAHLAALSALIAAGQTPGFVKDATVDKVSVSIVPPETQNQWQWWLNTTPYGQQLLALLTVKSVGGFFVGGSPVRAAFRNFRGRFGGWC